MRLSLAHKACTALWSTDWNGKRALLPARWVVNGPEASVVGGLVARAPVARLASREAADEERFGKADG